MYYTISNSQRGSAWRWIKSFFALNVAIGAIIVGIIVIGRYWSSIRPSLALLGLCNLFWLGFVLSIVMIRKSLQPDFPENFFLIMVPTNITFNHVWLFVLLPNFSYISYFSKNLPSILQLIAQPACIFGTFLLPCIWVIGTLYFIVRILKEIGKSFLRGLIIFIYTGSVVYTVTLFSDYLRTQPSLLPSGKWLIATMYGMILGGATIVAYLTKQRLTPSWMKMPRKNFIALTLLAGFASLYLTLGYFAPKFFPQLQISTTFYQEVQFAEMIAAGVECLLFLVMIIESCCCRRSEDYITHDELIYNHDYNYVYVEEPIQPIQFIISNPPITLQTNQNVYSNPPISIQTQQNNQEIRYAPTLKQNERISISQTKNENKEFNFDTTCCICLDEYKNGEKLMALKCGHIIHKNCAEDLKKVGKKCPLCRADVF